MAERDRVLLVLLTSKLRDWKQAVLAENAHPFENSVRALSRQGNE